MTSISASYNLTPMTLATAIESCINARRPMMIWGPPGVGKSQVAQQVAAKMDMEYMDIRALMIDPVDLRGVPYRDKDDRTRWAPPAFLPPQNSPHKHLLNLEELPSATPMVQASLYQLILDRMCGEYRLPEGAHVIACGNRENDRGVVHRMPSPLANRLIHIELEPSVSEWLQWAAGSNIAPEVLFFVQLRPEFLHQFDATSKEMPFPSPRMWEYVSDVVRTKNGMDPVTEAAMFRGAVGTGVAGEFLTFLRIWKELPHPKTIIDDPKHAPIPQSPDALIALCGSLFRLASDVTMDSIVTYAQRLRVEIGEFLIGSCVKRTPELQQTRAWVNWISQRGGM